MRTKFLAMLALIVFTVTPQIGYTEEDAEESQAQETVYIEIKPTLVVNLRTKAKKKMRYLKADIGLKINTQSNADKVNSALPAVKHALILYLSARTKKQVISIKNRNKLREGAMKAINKELMAVLEMKLVKDLYFTNFTVQ